MIATASEARGYTGHEHLDDVNLIHMNGRVYDPLLARMASADPILQSPLNSQNYNRYSYVMNNPLGYTDPSGYQRKAPNPTDVGAIGSIEATIPVGPSFIAQWMGWYARLTGYIPSTHKSYHGNGNGGGGSSSALPNEGPSDTEVEVGNDEGDSAKVSLAMSFGSGSLI